MKIATLSLLTCALASAQPPRMHQVAAAVERPKGAPTYADVCFRYGWIRKSEYPTVEDAGKGMRAFHATRVDWFYPGRHDSGDGVLVTPESKAFIDWCHSRDMKIGGAINNNTTARKWAYRKHHLDRFVGEVENAEFREQVIEWGKAQIDAGVDTMVCDDIFKYDHKRQDLWNEQVLAVIKAHKPGFTIAGNSGHSISTEYVERFDVDFHYSDNNFVPSPGQWWQASKAHRALNSAILVHPNRPLTTDTHRAMIALAYAAGAHVITPWDEYIHGGERLFADPADFADLYGFVRALGQAGHLNGYEDAAVGGFDLKENRYGQLQPITVSGGSGKLSVFGRAVPGDSGSALVFHLVESGKPTAAQLKLHRGAAAQLGAARLKCELLVPPAYNKDRHDKAEDTGNFSTLVQTTDLKPAVENGHLVFELPALMPWAVLVISTEPSP